MGRRRSPTDPSPVGHVGTIKNALLVTLLALAVALALVPPAAAAPVKPKATKPPASYFGMHYSALGLDDSYPATAIGSVRLWDTGTAWEHIQPERDVWEWKALDRAVATARAHGDSVMYVMGRTPSWAAKSMDGIATYGIASRYPPANDEDWIDYVSAVANRYQGEINAYEVWNEINIGGYYGGTVPEAVHLTELAYRTIKAIDHKAIVVAPSTTIRGSTGTPMQLRFAKLGGFRYADVVNVHLYPSVNGTPEDGARMLRTFRATMRKAGITKPIWNTEMNYGMPQNHVPRETPLTTDQQIAWVIRSHLLGWSGGARRQYWYDWSDASFLGIRMGLGGSDPSQASVAGKSLSTVRRWMNGKMLPCTVARKTGTYSCLINYGHGKRGLVRWNPKRTVTSHAPKGTTLMTDHRGRPHRGKQMKRVRLGEFPVLYAYTVKK